MKPLFINTTLTDHGVQKKSHLNYINAHCSKHRRTRRWPDVVALQSKKSKPGESHIKETRITALSLSPESEIVKTPMSTRSIYTRTVELTSDSKTNEPCRNELSLAPPIEPLLRLAIEANPKERNLLKFWLVTGRRYTYRTRSDPRYCPGLAGALMLSESPVYVKTLLIIGELIQCAISGRSMQPTHDFYRQRGHAYQAMNKMLDNPNISIYVKLVSLTNLGTIEFSLGRCDIQAKHLEAIATCIHLHGGAAKLEPQNAYQAQQLRLLYRTLWMNLPCFMLQKNALAAQHDFDLTLAEFLRLLKGIRDWMAAVLAEMALPDSTAHVSELAVECVFSGMGHPNSAPALSSLRTYLNWLIDSYLTNEMPFTELTFMLHTIHYILDLCRLQVRYSYTASQSAKLLLAAERCMIQSSDPEPLWKHSKPQMLNETSQKELSSNAGPIRLHPLVAMGIIIEVRDDIVPGRTEVEFEAVQCYSRIYKSIPLLSRQIAVSLGRKLAACALGVVYASLNPTDVPARLLATFDEEQLGALEQELRMNWSSAQDGSSPHSVFKGQPSDRIKLFSSSWIDSLYR